MNSSPPTIVFIIQHGVQLFYPAIAHRHGGAEVQLAWLARELAARGEVRPIVLLGAQGQPVRDEVDGVQLFAFAHKPGLPGRIAVWSALRRAFAGSARGRRALVQRGMGSVALNAALFSLASRIPLIYWVAFDLDCDPNAIPGYRHPLRTRAFDWSLRRARAIIAQHDGQAALLKNYLGRGPAAVIPNGWPPQPLPVGPRAHHLWIGHATRRKDPLALLDLAAQFPAEHFLMLMPEEEAEPDLLQKVRERAAAMRNVTLRGRVPFNQMPAHYAAAKTLLMTSRAEGYPNIMLQALWSGTPVLSLQIDPGGMLAAHQLGFHAHGRPEALAARLREICDSPELWRQLSSNAYHYAQQQLTVSSVADRFMAVLHQMRLTDKP